MHLNERIDRASQADGGRLESPEAKVIEAPKWALKLADDNDVLMRSREEIHQRNEQDVPGFAVRRFTEDDHDWSVIGSIVRMIGKRS